jgi:predicted transcriptional regulator
MATEKAEKAKVSINVGDFYAAALNQVKVAPHEELKSERDEYVAKYEAIRFDKNKDVTLDKAVYDKIHGMYEDIKDRGIQDAAQGYVKKEADGKSYIYIYSGRQRRALLELMRRREGVRKDDRFIVNIVKEKDVLDMLADQAGSNIHRVEETFFSQAAYIRGFRKKNWSNKQIADKLHVTEMLVSTIVRVDESSYLSGLVKSNRISLDTAASQFASKEFLDAFRDPTSHKINEEALEEKVESILLEMTEKGLAHSRNAVRAFLKSAKTEPSSDGPKTHIKTDQWKRIAEAPVGSVVPLAFHLLAKAQLGADHHSIAELIKINKDLEWLARVEWRTAAEIKRDQKKAAAENAAENARINAEMGIVPPNTKTAAVANHPDDEENEDRDDWEMPEEEV